jgi:hypothetical protein
VYARKALVEQVEEELEKMGVSHPSFHPFDRAVKRFILRVSGSHAYQAKSGGSNWKSSHGSLYSTSNTRKFRRIRCFACSRCV